MLKNFQQPKICSLWTRSGRLFFACNFMRLFVIGEHLSWRFNFRLTATKFTWRLASDTADFPIAWGSFNCIWTCSKFANFAMQTLSKVRAEAWFPSSLNCEIYEVADYRWLIQLTIAVLPVRKMSHLRWLIRLAANDLNKERNFCFVLFRSKSISSWRSGRQTALSELDRHWRTLN